MQTCRILLVDDSPTFLAAAEGLLAFAEWVKVVGRVSSGREALEQADRLKPDLILMDLSMPEMDGLAATRRLASRPGTPPVILMTVHDQLIGASRRADHRECNPSRHRSARESGQHVPPRGMVRLSSPLRCPDVGDPGQVRRGPER